MLTEEQRMELRGEIPPATAVSLAMSQWWKDMSARDVADAQLGQRLLCMDFADFQSAVEEALGRPVYTHEFTDRQALLDELHGRRGRPTVEQTLEKLAYAMGLNHE